MTDDIDDRLSRRFGNEEDDTDEDRDESDEKSSDTESSALNVKRDWHARSFYLPDGLNTELSTAFKRLDLKLAEAGTDISLKKTRHYYPLIVELGLEKLERLEQENLQERIERRERKERR